LQSGGNPAIIRTYGRTDKLPENATVNRRPALQRPLIARQEGIPLYVVLQERITELVEAERLRPGDALPSETSLQSRFGVSRATVRQALATLERRGLVERQQGRGTFLRFPALQRSLPELTSFSEHVKAQRMRPTSALVEYATVMAGPDDDTRHFPAGMPLVRAVRLRQANDVVVGLHTVFVPLTVAERVGFSEEILRADHSVSLYALMEAGGVQLEWAEEHLQARRADAAEARLLGVRQGTAVMSVRRLMRDAADQLVEVVRAIYLGDKYDYIVHLDRRSAGAARGGLITPQGGVEKEAKTG
jgi:GntR family transcriptional regulator